MASKKDPTTVTISHDDVAEQLEVGEFAIFFPAEGARMIHPTTGEFFYFRKLYNGLPPCIITKDALLAEYSKGGGMVVVKSKAQAQAQPKVNVGGKEDQKDK